MRSDRSACDAGPMIHLHEIGRTGCFAIFGRVFVPEIVLGEVLDEIVRGSIRGKKPFEVVPARDIDKVSVEYTAHKYSLSIADSSVLQCARAKGVATVLTDDLGLREVSAVRGLRPVGSVGILLRAFREGRLDRQGTLLSLDALMERSSLFITPALINKAKEAVRQHKP